MATMTLRFAFEKETKGAVRFQEVGEDGKASVRPEHWHAVHPQVGACRWQDTSDADRYHHDLTSRLLSNTVTVQRSAVHVIKQTMREKS
jgi:hypothetical protein